MYFSSYLGNFHFQILQGDFYSKNTKIELGFKGKQKKKKKKKANSIANKYKSPLSYFSWRLTHHSI